MNSSHLSQKADLEEIVEKAVTALRSEISNLASVIKKQEELIKARDNTIKKHAVKIRSSCY